MGLDDAIAEDWPERWAKANNGHGQSKKRNNLRKAYKTHLAFLAFKAANPHARCGNCTEFKPIPVHANGGMQCELESDFHGYAITTANRVCVKWTSV